MTDRTLETSAQMILMEIVNPVGVKILWIPQTATLYLVIQHPLSHMFCTVIRVIPEELRRNTQ